MNESSVFPFWLRSVLKEYEKPGPTRGIERAIWPVIGIVLATSGRASVRNEASVSEVLEYVNAHRSAFGLDDLDKSSVRRMLMYAVSIGWIEETAPGTQGNAYRVNPDVLRNS